MRNKDIIKQYVNTGYPIPEYQFNKLTPSLQKSYMRKRVISEDENRRIGYRGFEIKRLNFLEIDRLLYKSINTDNILCDEIMKVIPEKERDLYIKEYCETNLIPDVYWKYADEKTKKEQLFYMFQARIIIGQNIFKTLSDEQKYEAIDILLTSLRAKQVPDWYFMFADESLKEKMIDCHLEHDFRLSDVMLKYMTEINYDEFEEMIKLCKQRVPNKYFAYMNDDTFLEYLNKYCTDEYQQENFFKYITPHQCMLYIDFALVNDMREQIYSNNKLFKIAKENNLI